MSGKVACTTACACLLLVHLSLLCWYEPEVWLIKGQALDLYRWVTLQANLR
jgi:hypothetical protein